MEIKKTKVLNKGITNKNPCRVLYLPELLQIVTVSYIYNSETKTRIGSLQLFNTYSTPYLSTLNKTAIKDNLSFGVLSLSTFNKPNTVLVGCSDGFLRGYEMNEVTLILERSFGSDLLLHHSFNPKTKHACTAFSNGCIAYTKDLFNSNERIGIIKLKSHRNNKGT